MKRKLSTLAIASLVALNPLYTPVVLAQRFINRTQVAKNATEEGYWGLSQNKTLADVKLKDAFA